MIDPRRIWPAVYRGEGWTVCEGRWQASPPDEVDVIISDPPYDDRTSLGARSTRAINKRMVISFMGIDPAQVAPPLLSIARRWVICFCANEQLGAYQEAVGKAWIRAGAWVKTNPTPQITGERPGTGHEGIAIMHRRGRKRWNNGGRSATWIGPTCSTDRQHETQKPLWLMLKLVEAFTEPGELVYDPFCGSGTTGVACLRLGRRFIGHEMQPRYAKVAAERLAAEERGLTLADVRGGQTSIYDVLGAGADRKCGM